jgi:diacylglycerol kinase (ATP)
LRPVSGQENCKYFINVAALGFLVDVSQKTDPAIKNTLGIMSYYLRGMREIPNLKPFNVRITSDEYTAEEKIYFMLAMNGRSAGGFRRLSPKAVINDGLLDIMLFKEMPIRDIAPLLFNIVAGHHQENKNVIFFRTKKVHIEADQAIGSDVDGEKGCDLPLTIKVLEKRLMINTKYSDMEGTIW